MRPTRIRRFQNRVRHIIFSQDRRGAIVVLSAFLMVFIFAFLALTVDIGYMAAVRSELQNAADAAALAGSREIPNGTSAILSGAKEVALLNRAAGANVNVPDANVIPGVFNFSTKAFTPSASPNAVKVITQVNSKQFFFARMLSSPDFSVSTTAIAMLNPRDIVLLVDLSGSMNDDTEPTWAAAAINAKFDPLGFPSVANPLIQNVYDDFGFGTYPGTLQHVGSPLGVTADDNALAQMTKDNGPLSANTIQADQRIAVADVEATRKDKAYRWIIANQIVALMPNAKPNPALSSNYTYWEKYLDYIMKSVTVGGSGQPGMPRRGVNTSVVIPSSQDSERLDGFNNPNGSTFPSLSSSGNLAFRNKIGKLTYVQFMMDWGSDRSPSVSNSTNADLTIGGKTPLSYLNPDCPMHSEVTAGGTFNFPPREQPTHAVRRSLIAALEVVRLMNLNVSASERDRVSIITFDALDSYHAPTIRVPLTTDYLAAMTSCTTLQAVGDIGASTGTEVGMQLARDHVKPVSEGGQGRSYSNKVIILLTDGVPNTYTTSASVVNTYISENPNVDYYSSSYVASNSSLIQAAQGKSKNVEVRPVGMGLGADYDFLDRMARISGTAIGGESPHGTGNPTAYEAKLTEIFQKIIINPGSRLVQ